MHLRLTILAQTLKARAAALARGLLPLAHGTCQAPAPKSRSKKAPRRCHSTMGPSRGGVVPLATDVPLLAASFLLAFQLAAPPPVSHSKSSM